LALLLIQGLLLWLLFLHGLLSFALLFVHFSYLAILLVSLLLLARLSLSVFQNLCFAFTPEGFQLLGSQCVLGFGRRLRAGFRDSTLRSSFRLTWGTPKARCRLTLLLEWFVVLGGRCRYSFRQLL
jgi:hypothetical protein